MIVESIDDDDDDDDDNDEERNEEEGSDKEDGFSLCYNLYWIGVL